MSEQLPDGMVQISPKDGTVRSTDDIKTIAALREKVAVLEGELREALLDKGTQLVASATRVEGAEDRVAELERQRDWWRKRGQDVDAENFVINGRVAELEAIVEKLPVTADGVPVVVGQTVWTNINGDRLPLKSPEAIDFECAGRQREKSWFSCGGRLFHVGECYSTREAAEKATESEAGDG